MQRHGLWVLLSLMTCLWTGTAGAQTYLLDADFNAGANGFTSVVTGAAATDWELTSGGQAASSPQSVTGTLDGSQYFICNADLHGSSATQSAAVLTSPAFDGTQASGALLVGFDEFFLSVGGDSGTLEVFDGSTWQVVYTITTDTGDWGAPTAVTADLSAYKNASNQLRFTYDDDAQWGWWWAIDNVQVYYNTGPEIDVQRPVGLANGIPSGSMSDVGVQALTMSLDWVVANLGGASLTHTVAIANSPAAVNCTPGTPSLVASTAVGSTSTLTIPVTATADGAFSFRFTISSNDVNHATYDVDVRGCALGDDNLFYAGDFDGLDGKVNGRGFTTPTDAICYEQFDVPAGQIWTINYIFSNNLTDATSITSVDWEIRTGMSAGVGGTVVDSGTAVTGAGVQTGVGKFGNPMVTIYVQLGTPVILNSGTYFVAVRPVNGGGTTSYATTTSGVNGTGTPLNNHTAYSNSLGAVTPYEQVTDVNSNFVDLSIGVRGTSASSDDGDKDKEDDGCVANVTGDNTMWGLLLLSAISTLILIRRRYA